MASQGDAEGVRLGTRPHELSSYRLRVGYIQRHYLGILIQGEMAELWGKNSRAEEAPASAGIFAFRKSITSRGRMEKLRNFCTRRESAQRCAFAARVKAGGKHDEESGPADVRSPVWSEAPKIPNRVWLPLLEVPPSGEGIRFVTWYDGMGSRIGFGLE